MWDNVAQKNNRSTDHKTVTFMVGRILLWDGWSRLQSSPTFYSDAAFLSLLSLQREYCIFISLRFNAVVPTK